jgi:hypothetical protein
MRSRYQPDSVPQQTTRSGHALTLRGGECAAKCYVATVFNRLGIASRDSANVAAALRELR